MLRMESVSLYKCWRWSGVDYEDPDAHPVADFKAFFDVFRENLTRARTAAAF